MSNAVRLGYSVALAFFGACLAMNILALFGVDVAQAFGITPQQSGGLAPGVPVLIPVAIVVVLLAIPLLAARRFRRTMQSRAANTIQIILLLYVAASIGFAAFHLGVGGIGGARTAPPGYQQQAALMVQFITAWGMAGFFSIAMMYRAWLNEGARKSTES